MGEIIPNGSKTRYIADERSSFVGLSVVNKFGTAMKRASEAVFHLSPNSFMGTFSGMALLDYSLSSILASFMIDIAPDLKASKSCLPSREPTRLSA